MDAADLKLVRASLRHLLSATAPAQIVSELYNSGWPELLNDDAEAAVSALFEEQGRLPAASPALDLLMLAALGEPLEDDVVVVFPDLAAQTTPPATVLPGEMVKIRGLALCGAERAGRFAIALTRADGEVAMATIAARAATAIRRAPISGFDPDLHLSAINGEIPLRELELAPERGRWRDALSAARRALGHEMIGVTERMMQIAVEHVSTRRQFGKPIATFQAVKHRLADVYVALEAARTAAKVAWQHDDPFASSMLKALAGRAALQAARHCLQVCGGIGFTWEFPLQRYIKRAHMLDSLLGSSASLQLQIGEKLLAAGSLPRPGDL
jgi:hypothetical protein